MPTLKRYKCLRCEAEFEVPIYSVDEQMEVRRRNPNQGFGGVVCKNPACESADVMDMEELRRAKTG